MKMVSMWEQKAGEPRRAHASGSWTGDVCLKRGRFRWLFSQRGATSLCSGVSKLGMKERQWWTASPGYTGEGRAGYSDVGVEDMVMWARKRRLKIPYFIVFPLGKKMRMI